MVEEIRATLAALGDEEKAATAQRYFKTEVGEYGEGDRFLGIRMPVLHSVARRYRTLPPEEAGRLLRSPIHEERMVALLLLVHAFERGEDDTRQRIYELYLASTAYINNWDLVDLSAGPIVGGYLYERSRDPLYTLARSDLLWERRIAIMATFHFIRQGEFEETFRVARLLLEDTHDLIHKAVGWMLREVGKRDREAAEAFLQQHYRRMPRTMLRYAIERFPEARRQAYLKGEL